MDGQKFDDPERFTLFDLLYSLHYSLCLDWVASTCMICHVYRHLGLVKQVSCINVDILEDFVVVIVLHVH